MHTVEWENRGRDGGMVNCSRDGMGAYSQQGCILGRRSNFNGQGVKLMI